MREMMICKDCRCKLCTHHSPEGLCCDGWKNLFCSVNCPFFEKEA